MYRHCTFSLLSNVSPRIQLSQISAGINWKVAGRVLYWLGVSVFSCHVSMGLFVPVYPRYVMWVKLRVYSDIPL